MINKKLNKWEQQVQTGVLAGLKGRKTAQYKSLKNVGINRIVTQAHQKMRY